MKNPIFIIDKVLDEKYWRVSPKSSHYTGHCYHNSPIGSDDTCGTCDGAKCHVCKKVTEDCHFECSVPCNELEQIVKELKPDLLEEEVKELVYSDDIPKSDYYIELPSEKDLEEKYPDFHKKLREVDTDVMLKVYRRLKTLRIPVYEVFGDVKEDVMNLYEISINPETTKYHHYENQMDMYFFGYCNADHKVACDINNEFFVEMLKSFQYNPKFWTECKDLTAKDIVVWIMNNVSLDAKVHVDGDNYFYLHVSNNGEVISIDSSSLADLDEYDGYEVNPFTEKIKDKEESNNA